MNDLVGKFSALLLLASSAFNIYIGANVPLLQSVMQKLNANGGVSPASTFPLIMIFVAAGLYGVIGLILMSVKSVRGLNILMAMLLIAMAGGLSYSAAALYPNAIQIEKVVDTSSEVIGMFKGGETGKDYKQSMTAIGVYPAYASIFGAVAGFLGGILLFNRSS